MDSDFGGVSDWAANPYQGWFAEGQAFMGYPALAILQQRTEYRAIVETFAQEMTRKWIKFTSKGDADNTEKLAQIEDEFERLEVRDRFRECAEKDGFFGRSHLFADFGDWEKSEELKTSIGDGRDQASLQKLKGKKLERLRTIEATWVYPSIYNSTDPLAPDWYKPKSWFVMSKEVHASRLMTFIGREVPDILKPAYAFGGLSISQMVKPYVDYWLGIRSSAGDIVQAFSVFVLSTDLSQTLMEGGDQLFRRAELFNRVRRNSGLMMISKDDEDFKNVAAPLAGLHELVAQAQEHMAAPAKIPLVKLTGISPSGLNASSDGEMRCFNDEVHSRQESLFRPNLTRILGFVQIGLFGEVDPNIGFEFEPLYELSEKEQAEVRKIEAETGQILVDTGAISQEEERARVAADPSTPYAGLDPDDMPDLESEEETGLVVRGEKGEGAEDAKRALDRFFAEAVE